MALIAMLMSAADPGHQGGAYHAECNRGSNECVAMNRFPR